MMNDFSDTLSEIFEICSKNQIKFVITRFDCDRKVQLSDIDLLVQSKDYKKMIELSKKYKYNTMSHDEALGGRIKGMQINLVKPKRIKIDLHQDFTWRKSRYFDLNLIWNNHRATKIENIKVELPKVDIDAFIVLVNIIFEKTYFNQNDFEYLKRTAKDVFNNSIFDTQASKYNWDCSFKKFKNWFDQIRDKDFFPIFLPFSLIIYTYWEKFIKEFQIDFISLIYYLFFRLRFLLNKRLPYE